MRVHRDKRCEPPGGQREPVDLASTNLSTHWRVCKNCSGCVAHTVSLASFLYSVSVRNEVCGNDIDIPGSKNLWKMGLEERGRNYNPMSLMCSQDRAP